MKRSLAFAVAVAVAAVVMLVWVAWAHASSDIYSNIAPGSQGGAGGLAHQYPLSRFALDRHFKAVEASLTGGIDVSGVPAMMAHFLATVVWGLTAFIASTLIDLFGFAFSLDLVTGSEATDGAGALEPVAHAIDSLYAHTFGQPWLVVAIVLVGMWALWRGLIQRRYTETVGALGVSLIYLVIAMAFVTHPQRTIGEASRWTNQMSAAFLALSSSGDMSDEREAKRAASDQLFTLLVRDPWVVLNFGGVEHCVRAGTGDEKSDPVSLPVRPLSPNGHRDRALRKQLRDSTRVAADDGKVCINNRHKYAARFLRFGNGSDERDAEYEALTDGDTNRLPESQRSRGYRLGVEDKPVTDAMEERGQYERLLMALVVFGGELGAFLLLGSLSIAVILVQVVLLLLLAFSPVALVLGVFPGRGHDFFRAWLVRLAGFLVRKAVYSLILAVLLTVARALNDATGTLGWLLSWGLQAAFFWTVLVWRHKLTDQLLTATTGANRDDGRSALQTLYYARTLMRRAGRRHAPPEPPSPPSPSGPRGGPTQPGSPGPRQPRPPAPPRRVTSTSRAAAATAEPRTRPTRQERRQDRPSRRRDEAPAQHEPERFPDRDADLASGDHAETPPPPRLEPQPVQQDPKQHDRRPEPPKPPRPGPGVERPSDAHTDPTSQATPRFSAPVSEPAASTFAAGEASNPLLAALRRDRERLADAAASRQGRRDSTVKQSRGDKR